MLIGFGSALRLALALVNRQANDNHLQVVQYIAAYHSFPKPGVFWESYQPQLYHLIVAVLWQYLTFGSYTALILTANLVSCAAGIATLILLYRGLQGWQLPGWLQVLGLALVCFNSKMIGLSGEATNDALAIALGTAALLCAERYVMTGSTKWFVRTLVSTVAALLTKADTVVVFVAVGFLLLVVWLGHPSWTSTSRRSKRFALVYLLGILALFTLVGPYRANEQASGSPFAINVAPDPLPPLVHPTYVRRPGTTSIVDTYLTFRFVNLMEHPFITNGYTDYPLQRTSLWSQLYGRLVSVHFDQWPPSWRSTTWTTRRIVQGLLILGLLPAIFLILGIGGALFRSVRLAAGRFRLRSPEDARLLLHLVVVVVSMAYIVAATMQHRDFSVMKVEFLLPMCFSFLFLTMTGAQVVLRRTRRYPAVALGVTCWILAFCLLSIVDIMALIYRLAVIATF